MNKMMLIAVLLGFTLDSFCQDYIPSKDDLSRFPQTTTLVILEDNPLSEYNVMMREVMPMEWKMTAFDFISWKDFETKKLDPSFSFIVLNQVKFDKDITNAEYNFLSLVMGGSAQTLGSMPDLCSIPLSYYGIGDEEYSYKLGIFLRFMQNHVKLLMERPGMASENIFKHYNDNISDIKGKTLYLITHEMSKEVNTDAKIKKVYAGPVKFVTKEDIQKAIADKEDIVFLHKVGPESTNFKARCYKILIGAADAKFYYFDYHMVDTDMPDGFLTKDFKKLEKKN
jgi:hypothetical protein